MVHGAPEFLTFIYGQLVFFKPAKTIVVQAKTDHPLRPGIFLDYYTGTDEKFTGQYIAKALRPVPPIWSFNVFYKRLCGPEVVIEAVYEL